MRPEDCMRKFTYFDFAADAERIHGSVEFCYCEGKGPDSLISNSTLFLVKKNGCFRCTLMCFRNRCPNSQLINLVRWRDLLDALFIRMRNGKLSNNHTVRIFIMLFYTT